MIKIELSKTIKLTVPRFHLFSSSDIKFQLSKNDISDSDFSVFCSSMAYFFEFSRSLGSSASKAVSWIGSTFQFEHVLVLFDHIHASLGYFLILNKVQTFLQTGLTVPFSLHYSQFFHMDEFFTIFFKAGQNKELTASSFFVSNKKFTLYCINKCKSWFKNLESF